MPVAQLKNGNVYIADWPIPKAYWEPCFDHIVKCFARGAFERVAGTFVYKIKCGRGRYFVAAKKLAGEYHIYGWFFLRPILKAWSIEQSFIFTEHRGCGWSKVLYRALIRNEGLLLASGPQQTKNARHMWKRMIARGHYTVYAYDFRSGLIADVMYDPDNDEVHCVLQLYDSKINHITKQRDVRFLAIRKDLK